jgi:hypothetical protein
MPIPLEMCTRLSAGVLRSVQEFHEAVTRAALICCQKHDERVISCLNRRGVGFTLGHVCFSQRVGYKAEFK